MELDINPSSDVLIVKEIGADDRTPGGLFVPEQVKEKDSLCKARILKAGPGQTNRAGQVIPHEYKEGDVVVFDKMRGYPVTHGGQQYLFVNAHQIFGTVNEVVN